MFSYRNYWLLLCQAGPLEVCVDCDCPLESSWFPTRCWLDILSLQNLRYMSGNCLGLLDFILRADTPIYFVHDSFFDPFALANANYFGFCFANVCAVFFRVSRSFYNVFVIFQCHLSQKFCFEPTYFTGVPGVWTWSRWKQSVRAVWP